VKHETIISAIDTAALNMGVSGAAWLSNPENIAIGFDNGDIALFEHEGDHDYQVHVLFASGGRTAIKHVREAFGAMFEQHGAELIFGLVPDERGDVKMMDRNEIRGQAPDPRRAVRAFRALEYHVEGRKLKWAF
jgi:hypothetical protein